MKKLFKKWFACKHRERYYKVLNAAATCETVVEACIKCDKILTKPKTDCR